MMNLQGSGARFFSGGGGVTLWHTPIQSLAEWFLQSDVKSAHTLGVIQKKQ